VRYWRAPWGLITPATEEVANKYRLLLVGWAADTEDWQGGTPEEMLARIRGRISGIASSGGRATRGLSNDLAKIARSLGEERAQG
jgi:peptidoglycan/xylan/chitin deacetylase (PgdA/CDA1 family)